MGGLEQLSQHSSSSVTKDQDGVKKNLSSDRVIINLDHGDPMMFEEYWKRNGDKCTITISGSQSLSYFSDPKNLCWFLEPEFGEEIKRLHNVVGNAITEDRYIVVGTGSTQLFQAALYALSSPGASSEPINVVSAVPYFSCYPAITDFLKSGLHKWAGDAWTYDKEEPYIEVVTSPNNPDGNVREPVVKRNGGMVIHDLAYYWPQYTPITSAADHDLMLFTVSKCTGHAGARIGWALVKDKDVAAKMKDFITISTIGVSKDSQLRAAKILRAVSESCQNTGLGNVKNIFSYGRSRMNERWERLRAVIKQNGLFSLPEYSNQFCNFLGECAEISPAFAWLESKGKIEDTESFLKGHNIITRSGKAFGVSNKYVRISMLDREETFNLLLERLSTL
ncbi:hypothetical protein AQUCO_00200039v1 [Aquilegia coerulea]|uniref:Alliinase C-terminal domain-containing protein n=1 Tax=Aquilegia coerulea TaxID=218851 RepID=A0A2G5F1C1_AQUCA|nr:hypothetical protein AQUCO_00200039v1 [Aquilegia coerulea]